MRRAAHLERTHQIPLQQGVLTGVLVESVREIAARGEVTGHDAVGGVIEGRTVGNQVGD